MLLKGITAVMTAKADWESKPIVEKIQMFLKVISEQMADIYRAYLNAKLLRKSLRSIDGMRESDADKVVTGVLENDPFLNTQESLNL